MSVNAKELALVVGIPRVPVPPPTGFSYREPQPQVLSLLGDPAGGSGLATSAWQPQIAGLKGTTLWADSAVSPGRELMNAEDANVLETLTITASASTQTLLAQRIATLARFRELAHAFWDDQWSIGPVYLKWLPQDCAGPQYALIYTLDITEIFPDQNNALVADVTIAIERQPYWQPLPPGSNPILWTFKAKGQTPTSYQQLGLVSTLGNHLKAVTIQNRAEYADSANLVLTTQNYIELAASEVPGDVPPLIEFFFEETPSDYSSFLCGVKSVFPSVLAAGGGEQQNSDTLAACWGTLGTNAAVANDTGAVKSPLSVNAQRVEISFAAGVADALRLRFDNGQQISANQYLGTWTVLLRCRQVGGAAGDITMYLEYGHITSATARGIRLPTQLPTIIAGVGNTVSWGLTYMGQVTIPIDGSKAVQDNTGLGLSTVNGDFSFNFYAARSTGVGVLYLCDLILIPIDEGSLQAVSTDITNANGFILDNTGYSTHGAPRLFAGQYINSIELARAVNLTGSPLLLKPNQRNRIYFLGFDEFNQSNTQDAFNIKLNIIPRCRSIREI